MRNSDLLIKIVNALILTSSRKTSKIYAVSVINTIIENNGVTAVEQDNTVVIVVENRVKFKCIVIRPL